MVILFYLFGGICFLSGSPSGKVTQTVMPNCAPFNHAWFVKLFNKDSLFIVREDTPQAAKAYGLDVKIWGGLMK